MDKSAINLILVFSLALGPQTSTGLAEDRDLAVTTQADSTAEVRDVRVEDDTVHGTLVNKSSKSLRDVRLLIRHAWLWKTERSPGNSNPGRSEFYSFPGEIAAGASAPFTYHLERLDAPRGEGKFMTSAEIMSYTLVGP